MQDQAPCGPRNDSAQVHPDRTAYRYPPGCSAHPWASLKKPGQASHSTSAGKPRPYTRPPFSRVHCRLLVARIHHPNPLPHTPIVNSSNMPPAEREDDLNSFSLQYLSDQPAAVDHAHSMPLSVFITLTNTAKRFVIS